MLSGGKLLGGAEASLWLTPAGALELKLSGWELSDAGTPTAGVGRRAVAGRTEALRPFSGIAGENLRRGPASA